MAQRDDLIILQKAAEKAIAQGWSPTGQDILSVDYTLDPPSVVLRTQPLHTNDNNDMYLAEYFPLFENEFALNFWGTSLAGDAFTGTLPAWMYHQHRLLNFLQWKTPSAFFEYIAAYL